MEYKRQATEELKLLELWALGLALDAFLIALVVFEAQDIAIVHG